MLVPLLASCVHRIPRELGPSLDRTGLPGRAAQSARIAALEEAWSASGCSALSGSTGGIGNGAVSAAWWGFDSADATESIRAAIASGAATVYVPNMGSPWIVSGTIELRGGLELIFGEGVVVRAAEGAFRTSGDCLFEANGVGDLRVSGYGAAWRMKKSDYQRPPYEPSQWRHALSLRGVSRVEIAGLEISSSGGDGVYVGTSNGPEGRIPCADLVLRDLILLDHHRQGVSVISADRLLIEGCELRGTGGALPGAGIDFEPNSRDPGFRDCVVRSCIISDNQGPGLLFSFGRLKPDSGEQTIRIETTIVDDHPVSLYFNGLETKPRGTIVFSDCVFTGLCMTPPSEGLDLRYENTRPDPVPDPDTP